MGIFYYDYHKTNIKEPQNKHKVNIKCYLCIDIERRSIMATTKAREKNTKIASEPRRLLTREERRAKVVKKITSSKEEAKKFLTEIGFLDKEGNVAEVYR